MTTESGFATGAELFTVLAAGAGMRALLSIRSALALDAVAVPAPAPAGPAGTARLASLELYLRSLFDREPFNPQECAIAGPAE